MQNLIRNLLVAGVLLTSAAASADDNGRLFIIGDATPYGWDLDMAQALMSSSENPAVYTGTLYLKGGENNTFKFMQAHEWGSTEYGIPAEAAVSGEIQLASGTLDDGYSKMYVAEAGNYYISVDTQNLKGEISRSEYQENEIQYCTLFLVGDATEGGWSVEEGTPLYQSAALPCEYSATVALKSSGSFKIATALRGAGSWDAKYYYFKDVDEEGKISTDSTDDRQWKVSEDGNYIVTVNTISGTISITKDNGIPTGIEAAVAEAADVTTSYYTLQGCKVTNPTKGVFIKVTGNNVEKVILR